MVVSPLEIPGQILVRGYIPNANEFPDIIGRSIELLETTLQHFGVKKLTPLQERIVFALASGLDLFVAGPSNAGKRTAYLILVVRYILEQLCRSKVPAEVCNDHKFMITFIYYACGNISSYIYLCMIKIRNEWGLPLPS